MNELILCDIETDGLDINLNHPIEISLYRFSTNEQKTWFIRPLNFDHISNDALRVNGHNLDDLKGLTKLGKEKYMDASKVLVEIENWVSDDMVASSDRYLAGHNVANFDKPFLQNFWARCGSKETFPFSTKYSIDTMCLQFALDFANNSLDAGGYSLFNLCKRYSIKNEKAHSAEFDTKATVELLKKIFSAIKK